jgi:hypothetical protein
MLSLPLSTTLSRTLGYYSFTVGVTRKTIGKNMANWARLFSSFTNMVAFFREAWFLGKPAWAAEDIPDLTDMVIIVTGGSSGIGLQTVRVSQIY